MGFHIDLHLHTQRHSPCSNIDPEHLIGQAIRAGLDGLVITEHAYQWREADLAELVDKAEAPGFLLLAGFEYGSRQGDILMYGLDPVETEAFVPELPPAEAIAMAHARGAVCVAAHPTRAAMGFDEEILTLPLDAIEVRSVNLQPHEQRLAEMLAVQSGRAVIAASDAHRLADVGRYVTEFDDPIQSMSDLQKAFRRGRFRPASMEKRTAAP